MIGAQQSFSKIERLLVLGFNLHIKGVGGKLTTCLWILEEFLRLLTAVAFSSEVFRITEFLDLSHLFAIYHSQLPRGEDLTSGDD